MNCHLHASGAIGVCAYCGRGLCPACAEASAGQPRLVCSPACAAALARDDRAMQSILQKSEQSARASANYSYLCALLSGGGAIGAYNYLPSDYLIWFTSACSVIFLISGIFYSRIAKKSSG